MVAAVSEVEEVSKILENLEIDPNIKHLDKLISAILEALG
jgi:hypothetical protein